jgi:CrcB protein
MTWLLIAAGAALGAPARYLLDTWVSSRKRNGPPLGTLLINVSGCALLGALLAVSGSVSLTYAAVGIGFCGAFTTFSTFAWETFALAEDGAPRVAIANVALSLLLGLGAASVTYWGITR